MTTPTDEQLMTPRQVSRLLNISVRTLLTWKEKGRGPAAVKIGPGDNGSVRYRPSAVAAWLEERTNTTGSA